jgi:transposase
MRHKAIARSLGMAASTVRMTVERAAAAGLSWPLPDDMSDAVLEDKLHGRAGTNKATGAVPSPMATIHRELKRKRHAVDPVGRVHR